MTDPERTPDLEKIVARLPRGWGVIYRHFGAADRREAGQKLAQLCRGRLVFLVSADPRLAAALRADGVHWPEAQLMRVRARRPFWIETASAHSRAAIDRAAQLGVDAAILSPVFPSRSPSAGKPIGVIAFRQLARTARLPVYALGGVNAGNASRITSHAAGFAAVEAIAEGWGS